MTRLNYLHEPALLANLRHRFERNHVYTYTGKICIAVNPFNWQVRAPHTYICIYINIYHLYAWLLQRLRWEQVATLSNVLRKFSRIYLQTSVATPPKG